MATANFSAQRAIHATLGLQDRIQTIRAPRTTESRSTGILALFATFRGGQPRANFTIAPPQAIGGHGLLATRDLPLSILFR